VELDLPIGDDGWSGVSPFCQMIHWENATVLMFEILETGPCANAKTAMKMTSRAVNELR